MTPSQERKREKIVKAMKKNFSDFRQRYGSDAKSVMYATATKQAMDEEERKPRVFRIKTQGGTVTSTRPPDTKSSPRTSGPVMHGPSSNMGPKPNQKMPVASGKAKRFYNKSDREAMERAPIIKNVLKKRKEKEEAEKAAVRADAERISKQSAERKAAGKKLIDPKTQKEVGAKKDTKPIDSTGVKITQASKKETEKHEKKMRKFDRSRGGVISKGRKGRKVGFSGSMLLKRNFDESFMSFGQFFLAEQEQLDELSRKTLGSYMYKASDARGHRGLPTKKVDNRYSGVYKASKRIDKMEKDSMNKMKSEETINELSPETLGSYVQKASKDDQKVKISVKGRPSKLGPDYVRHGRTAEVFPQKRNVGMKRALTKLQKKMKTEETINELSYNTLSSY